MKEPDVHFWDRLAEMPDADALFELSEVRDWAVFELSKCKRTDPGNPIVPLLTKVNRHIKEINIRHDRITWRKAIIAVAGEDVYAAVSAWRQIHAENLTRVE